MFFCNALKNRIIQFKSVDRQCPIQRIINGKISSAYLILFNSNTLSLPAPGWIFKTISEALINAQVLTKICK